MEEIFLIKDKRYFYSGKFYLKGLKGFISIVFKNSDTKSTEKYCIDTLNSFNTKMLRNSDNENRETYIWAYFWLEFIFTQQTVPQE